MSTIARQDGSHSNSRARGLRPLHLPDPSAPARKEVNGLQGEGNSGPSGISFTSVPSASGCHPLGMES